MILGAHRTELAGIAPLRALFLHETNAQVRYDACHVRGWTDSYLLTVNGRAVGYGSVKGDEPAGARDTIFELYVAPPFRRSSRDLFVELLRSSGARFVECQSNHELLASMLHEFASDVGAKVVLFEHRLTTSLRTGDDVVFRERREDDSVPVQAAVPVGEYVIEAGGRVVASGGFLLHYNHPFADVYMEVDAEHRRRGVGSFLVQEIIAECYLAGRVPAARCNIENLASRATLTKAGMRQCGFMLEGAIIPI
jgi:GNAT superfamily N-acetyltransferase